MNRCCFRCKGGQPQVDAPLLPVFETGSTPRGRLSTASRIERARSWYHGQRPFDWLVHFHAVFPPETLTNWTAWSRSFPLQRPEVGSRPSQRSRVQMEMCKGPLQSRPGHGSSTEAGACGAGLCEHCGGSPRRIRILGGRGGSLRGIIRDPGYRALVTWQMGNPACVPPRSPIS